MVIRSKVMPVLWFCSDGLQRSLLHRIMLFRGADQAIACIASELWAVKKMTKMMMKMILIEPSLDFKNICASLIQRSSLSLLWQDAAAAPAPFGPAAATENRLMASEDLGEFRG